MGHCSPYLPRCFADRLFLYIHGSLMANQLNQREPHRLDSFNPKKAGKRQAERAIKKKKKPDSHLFRAPILLRSLFKFIKEKKSSLK